MKRRNFLKTAGMGSLASFAPRGQKPGESIKEIGRKATTNEMIGGKDPWIEVNLDEQVAEGTLLPRPLLEDVDAAGNNSQSTSTWTFIVTVSALMGDVNGNGVANAEDIIYLVRTAYKGAHNFHDANRITFHRLRAFRSLL